MSGHAQSAAAFTDENDELVHALMLARLDWLRRHAEPVSPLVSDAPPDALLDLLAVWNGAEEDLRKPVYDASAASPFELIECWEAFSGADGRKRFFCRFLYHGDIGPDARLKAERAEFEKRLRDALSPIAQWEDIPRVHDA
ncbi:MAG: hypothetical protein AAFW81_01035 [Pseudomonadota bacterium]